MPSSPGCHSETFVAQGENAEESVVVGELQIPHFARDDKDERDGYCARVRLRSYFSCRDSIYRFRFAIRMWTCSSWP